MFKKLFRKLSRFFDKLTGSKWLCEMISSLNNNQDKIEVVDNFLSLTESERVLEFCESSQYSYGEADSEDSPPAGMTCEILQSDYMYHFFKKKLSDAFPIVLSRQLQRMYINCFSPLERPFFHIDAADGYTFLYYPQKNLKIDDGGETQFLINESIYGILPLQNRIVKFDASILHRATSLRNSYRFTVAIKYL